MEPLQILSAVVKPWNRETVADGVDFEENTLVPLKDNTKYLWNYLKDINIEELSTISSWAVYGNSAYAYLSAWMPGGTRPLMSQVQGSAQSGLSAWNELKDFNLSGVQTSAIAGQKAWEHVATAYSNFAAIKSKSESGASAWEALKDYNLKEVETNAKLGASAALALNDTRRENYKWAVDNVEGITNSSYSGYSAYACLFGDEARYAKWNAYQEKVDATAKYWNSAYSAITSESGHWSQIPSASYSGENYWNPAATYINASAAELNDKTDHILASAENWSSAYNIQFVDEPCTDAPIVDGEPYSKKDITYTYHSSALEPKIQSSWMSTGRLCDVIKVDFGENILMANLPEQSLVRFKLKSKSGKSLSSLATAVGYLLEPYWPNVLYGQNTVYWYEIPTGKTAVMQYFVLEPAKYSNQTNFNFAIIHANESGISYDYSDLEFEIWITDFNEYEVSHFKQWSVSTWQPSDRNYYFAKTLIYDQDPYFDEGTCQDDDFPIIYRIEWDTSRNMAISDNLQTAKYKFSVSKVGSYEKNGTWDYVSFSSTVNQSDIRWYLKGAINDYEKMTVDAYAFSHKKIPSKNKAKDEDELWDQLAKTSVTNLQQYLQDAELKNKQAKWNYAYDNIFDGHNVEDKSSFRITTPTMMRKVGTFQNGHTSSINALYYNAPYIALRPYPEDAEALDEMYMKVSISYNGTTTTVLTGYYRDLAKEYKWYGSKGYFVLVPLPDNIPGKQFTVSISLSEIVHELSNSYFSIYDVSYQSVWTTFADGWNGTYDTLNGHDYSEEKTNQACWDELEMGWDLSTFSTQNLNKWNSMVDQTAASAKYWNSAANYLQTSATELETINTSATAIVGSGKNTFNSAWSGIFAKEYPGATVHLDNVAPFQPYKSWYGGDEHYNYEWWTSAYECGMSGLTAYAKYSANLNGKKNMANDEAALRTGLIDTVSWVSSNSAKAETMNSRVRKNTSYIDYEDEYKSKTGPAADAWDAAAKFFFGDGTQSIYSTREFLIDQDAQVLRYMLSSDKIELTSYNQSLANSITATYGTTLEKLVPVSIAGWRANVSPHWGHVMAPTSKAFSAFKFLNAPFYPSDLKTWSGAEYILIC